MDIRLENLYSELCDELYDAFSFIVETEDEEYVSIPYRGSDVYEGSIDRGRIILGCDDYQKFSYAYRITFNSKPNKPDQISWCRSDQGFSRLSILLGEKEFIMNDILNHYARRTERLSVDRAEYIEELFEDIRNRRQSIQREYKIDDIKRMIEDRNKEKLQNVISPDRSSDVELWKLMYSYDRNGDVIENSIDFPYIDDSKIVARGERIYCTGEETKNYPIGLVIEETDRVDKFFIHRIPRTDRLDDHGYNWSESYVQNLLGYKSDYRSANESEIPSRGTVRIAEQVTVEKKSYDEEIREYQHHLFSEFQRVLHNVYYRFYRDNNKIDLSGMNARITPDSVNIDGDCPTDEVKEIQLELGVKESDVRRRQKERGIERLSSNLRSDIVKNLYIENFSRWLFNRSYSEIKDFQYKYEEDTYRDIGHRIPHRLCGVRIEEELTDLVIQDPSEINERGMYNLAKHVSERVFTNSRSRETRVDELKVRISDSAKYVHDIDMKGYDSSVIKRIIVPNAAKMFVEIDGTQKSYKLQKGIYVFRELNTIRTVHYSS